MPKEPINLKLAGPMRVTQIKEHPTDCQCGNHEAHAVSFGALKEAIASCKLNGDTMDCTKCPLGKDYRKQIAERLSLILETSPPGKKLGYIETALQTILKETEES